MEDGLEGVQQAFDALLQQATTQFQDTVKEATDQMQQLIKEAAKKDAPPAPEAKWIDDGLWLNKQAVDVLLTQLDNVVELIKELAGEQPK